MKLIIFGLVIVGIVGVIFFARKGSNNISHDKEILLEEVGPHSGREDCWVTINSLVYEFTDFIKTPLGEVFDDSCGQDASEVFLNLSGGIVQQNEVGDVLPKYLLGKLITR